MRTRGAELEFDARPTANLGLSGGVTYADAEFPSFKRAACWGSPDRQPSCLGGIFDASGASLANSPKWTVSLQGFYNRELGGRLRGFASMDWYWRSEVNDSLGDPSMKRGAYGLLGGSIGISNVSGRWRLSAWARNLLDQDFTGTIVPTPLSLGSYSQFPVEDARRIVGMKLSYATGP
jgi:iron complex outermembrane receptor protein